MKPILTPQQMKKADEYAIKKLHIPSLHLMENAGESIADEIGKIIESQSRLKNRRSHPHVIPRVLIFCGKGNNGGDGFVVARLLVERQLHVTVVLIEDEKELRGDALVQFQKMQESAHSGLEILRYDHFQKQKQKTFSIIVDAMLGTSFSGELEGKYLKAVQWSNKQSSVKIAVDIPTGLNGETGVVLSDAFRADVTVTMSNPKIGFYCERAKEFTGKIIIADIGIPRKALPQGTSTLIELLDIRKSFPPRASNSHKHSVGKIFILSGSKSMMGAAFLCSQSAMRSGAGQVILGVPDSEYPVIAKRTVEVMPLGLPCTRDGSLALSAMSEIEERIRWATIVLLGCGVSRNGETTQLIRDVIRSCNRPLVIDADGLYALAGHLDILKKRKAKHVILTPHLGEFSRLTEFSAADITANRYSIASEFAKEFKVTLVLKGAPTITADPLGKIIVNSTGNPGMSTAGSGDVLAGIIASLQGQGNSSVKAAVNGVFIHGKAGDIAAKKIGTHGMIARDIIRFIPDAIREVLQQ